MTMSDRIAVMRAGRIDQIGNPEEVYERPATEFVAGFLGASNLLDGEVQARDGGHATVALRDGSTVSVRADRLSGIGPAVKLGVRPEKLRLDEGGIERADGRNRITGLVRTVSFIGVSYQYTVDGPGGRTITVYAQNVGTEVPSPGSTATLSWRPEDTFVVSPEASTGDREEEEE